MADRVLVTGISGFLGGHVALDLLRSGYAVRGSVRELKKADKVRNVLQKAGADITRLDFMELDLTSDANWQEAMVGCRFLQHTASPLTIKMPRDRDELVRPAVEGTRRAITAALAGDIERIVVTSSIAAVVYGHGALSRPFTEADWTVSGNKGVNAYSESKTRAEQEAWSLMERAGRRADLATINPGVILGPLLDDDPGTSSIIVKRLLEGSAPAAPKIAFGVIDVRDVAELHRRAMETPEAGGHRHIAVERPLRFIEAANILRKSFPDCANKLPRFELPNWVLRFYALFDRDLRGNSGEFGRPKTVISDRALALLGHPFILAADAVTATARTMLANRIIG